MIHFENENTQYPYRRLVSDGGHFNEEDAVLTFAWEPVGEVSPQQIGQSDLFTMLRPHEPRPEELLYCLN